MSSGISTEMTGLPSTVLAPGKPAPVDAEVSTRRDSFQAWHFFVLASILLATVAVVLTRRSAPEHLILLSFTVASAGAVAAAVYWMLLPFIRRAAVAPEISLTERGRAALEREKMLALRTIKELEFDHAMGKLSQKDFDEMASRLRARAIGLMKQLDDGVQYRSIIEKDLERRMQVRLQPDLRVQPDACSCGTSNDADAVFCKKCGTRLQVA